MGWLLAIVFLSVPFAARAAVFEGCGEDHDKGPICASPFISCLNGPCDNPPVTVATCGQTEYGALVFLHWGACGSPTEGPPQKSKKKIALSPACKHDMRIVRLENDGDAIERDSLLKVLRLLGGGTNKPAVRSIHAMRGEDSESFDFLASPEECPSCSEAETKERRSKYLATLAQLEKVPGVKVFCNDPDPLN